MKRSKHEIARFDAKVWLEKKRHADLKTGHADSTKGTECFKVIKEFLKAEEPDSDPWDDRTEAALDGYDERHKPEVSPDPKQPRLLQPHAEWKLDANRRVTIPEGEATRDDIDLRRTVLDTTFQAQEAIYRKESGFLTESRRRAKNRKQKMNDLWRPDNTK